MPAVFRKGCCSTGQAAIGPTIRTQKAGLAAAARAADRTQPNNLKKGLIFCKSYSIIIPVEQTESCPSWSKEHDWKSCKPSKRLRGFESLALRQKPMEVKHFCRLFFSARSTLPRRRKPPKTTSRRRNIFGRTGYERQAGMIIPRPRT